MTTTPLLGITELTPNQTGKETTINNAILALENATNANLAVSFAAGNVTLSVAQLTNNVIFRCTGLTADRILNVPALVNGSNTVRLFSVFNDSTFLVTVQITGGAGDNIIVPVGFCFLCFADGNGNIIQASQVVNPSKFYRYGGSAPSDILGDEILMDHIVSEDHDLAANFAGSKASVGTNPTATWIGIVKKNGANIGTVTVSTGGVVTLATVGGTAVTVVEGDVISFHAPIAPDATILRLRWTFEGLVD